MQHVAQLNLGRLAFEIDDPRVEGFLAGVDMINRIAEASPGFVWKFETGRAGTVDTVVDGDPRILVNLTVWTDVESLRHFTFNTLHKRFLARRGEWFAPMERPHLVMWPTAEAHRPSLEEALERLERLRTEGEGPDAFGWRSWEASRASETSRA